MEYKDVSEYLLRLEKFGMKLGLDNINQLLSHLGNPHQAYPLIHIAGTNGKGSTGAILESILANSGYRVGLYTSPHLVDFRERIRINARYIDQKYITDFFESNIGKFDDINPTFFEVVTALAFTYFRDEKVDLVVAETGLGGRFDATNIINPVTSVITNIDEEHVQHLGDNVSQIAFEKAGIIKNGIPVVTATHHVDAQRVLRQVCKQRKAKLISIFDETQWVIKDINERKTELDVFTRSQKYYNLRLSLAGRHQLENAICSLIAAELVEEKGIKVTTTGVSTGFRSVKWPGRLQRISTKPEVILDVCHNPAAMRTIHEYFSEFYKNRHLVAVFGILSDKDSTRMLQDLVRFADVIILTKPMTDRAADPEVLAREVARIQSNFQVIPFVRDAYLAAIDHAKHEDVVLVTGSHYTVGEVMAYTGGRT
ncbi:MAG: hypothetical protein B6D58_01870 [candidate division Zixibacteria bacterium 4484_95]|nr:MAG: hypothetical protein B6D58_01870 [candidate division Zixibacteria bacterium 4484_95]RKX19261.1 MAG: bifunctional folylpolyglutamate synthase/dihydrofolate synthase [candidate division Zixibacteria bacterium]